MRKIFSAAIILFAVSCGSGESANTSSDSANTALKKGNSAGSNTVEMDTMHMDTSTQKTTDTLH